MNRLKESLSARGLAVPFRHEKKQRAVVYLLLNDNADEKMNFAEF